MLGQLGIHGNFRAFSCSIGVFDPNFFPRSGRCPRAQPEIPSHKFLPPPEIRAAGKRPARTSNNTRTRLAKLQHHRLRTMESQGGGGGGDGKPWAYVAEQRQSLNFTYGDGRMLADRWMFNFPLPCQPSRACRQARADSARLGSDLGRCAYLAAATSLTWRPDVICMRSVSAALGLAQSERSISKLISASAAQSSQPLYLIVSLTPHCAHTSGHDRPLAQSQL